MAQTIAAAANRAMTNVAHSLASSTAPSTSTGEREHKLAFLETFRRWETLFKRKDTGSAQAEMWFVAEYYDSLRHLSPEGLAALTRLLKENCTFFPTIRECLDLMKPKDRFDYAHPFIAHYRGERSPLIQAPRKARPALAAPETKELTHGE